MTSLLIAAAAMTMTCFASGSVGGGGLHRRTALVVLMTVVVCSHRWSWNPWGESVDDSANDTLDLDDLNSSDGQSQAYNQLLKYAARKAPSCADDQFSDLGRLVRMDSTALSLVKETTGVPNLSDQDVIRWMTNSSFFYRKCGADSCLRRGRSAVLVDCDCTREFGYKCIYAAGHPRLQMKVSVASYDELFGKLWDRSGSLITAITRILVVPVALAQDLIGLLYGAYAQRATAHPALLDTKLLDLPDPRVQKLAVNMLIGYLLTLVNSLCGVAINCEASEGMSRGEWFLRLVGAWVLLFGGLYLGAWKNGPYDEFCGSATYGDLLLSHLASTLFSTIYLLEESVGDMDYSRWFLYPVIFPIAVSSVIIQEVIRECYGCFVVVKLVILALGFASLAAMRRVADCTSIALSTFETACGLYCPLAIPWITLLCAYNQHILVWRSPTAFIMITLSLWFMPPWTFVLLSIALWIFNMSDFNNFDLRIAGSPILTHVPVGSEFDQYVPDRLTLLALAELVIALIIAYFSLRKVLRRIVLSIVRDSVDLMAIC